MLRIFTGLWLAATVAYGTPAQAQTQTKRGRSSHDLHTTPAAANVSTIDCLGQDSSSARAHRGATVVDKRKKHGSDIPQVQAPCGPQQPAGPGASTPIPPAVAATGTANASVPATSAPAPNGSTTPTTGGTAQSATITTTAAGNMTVTGVTGDALLDGLLNINIQQLLLTVQLIANVDLQNAVIDISDVLNNVQVEALVQALNTNPQASIAANEITWALRQSGAIAPDETVVGVDRSTGVYDNRTLTEALQQRGILRPGERVVGVKGPRVYKAKR